MRTVRFLAALAALFLAAPAPAATTQVDQSQELTPAIGGVPLWQTFTPSVSGPLAGVEVHLGFFCMMPSCVGDTLEVAIVTTSAGAPTETSLGTVNLAAAALPQAGAQWVEVDLAAEGIELTADTVYAIRLANLSPNIINVFGSTTDAYAGGTVYSDTDGEGDFDPVPGPLPGPPGLQLHDVAFRTVMSLPLCGDGVEDDGETCDDGNTISGDLCSAACQDEFCGDGIVSGDEWCDDANSAAGDGCTPTCTLEASLRTCQDTIAKAGAKYAASRMKAIQKCRTLVAQGKPMPVDHPSACATEPATEIAIFKAAGAARKAIAGASKPKCTDALIGALGLCADTLDAYLSPTGNSGCFLSVHDEATDTMLREEYGY